MQGLSKEEAFAYIETEGQSGEFVIRKCPPGMGYPRDEWYATATGHTLGQIRYALTLEN
jgi:hypothetical protein